MPRAGVNTHINMLPPGQEAVAMELGVNIHAADTLSVDTSAPFELTTTLEVR